MYINIVNMEDIYGKVISYKCRKEGESWVTYFTLHTNDGKMLDCQATLYIPLLESDVVLLPHSTEIVQNVYKVVEHPYVLMDPGDNLIKCYFNKALDKPQLRNELLEFYKFLTTEYGNSTKANDVINRIEDMIMLYDKGTPLDTKFTKPFLDAIYSWFRENVCFRRFQLLNLHKDDVKKLFDSFDMVPYRIYSKVFDNPYMLYPLGLESCTKAFKVLRYSPTEQEKSYGNAMITLYQYVSVKGWTCIPDSAIPELILKNKEYYTKAYDLQWFHNYVYFPITYKVEMRLKDWFRGRVGYSCTDEQDNVDKILNNKLTIVMGEAGTGKTTLISKVIERIIDEGKTFHVCSFTGKAVQRAMQVLEKNGIISRNEGNKDSELTSSFSTIHRLMLEPREIDYLIIDEISMVSMPLFYSLIQYIDDETKVLFVGDPNQLEPIEWGHMMECIINCKSLQPNIIRLTTVFRQKEGSGLIDNIRSVIDNRMIQNGENFMLCQCQNKEIDDMVKGIYEFEHNTFPDHNIMVLTPYTFKLKYINDIARNIILDNNHSLIKDKWGNTFALGDRVMLTNNDVNEGGKGALYNGDEGTIVDILGKVIVKWNRTGDVIGYDPNSDFDQEDISISIFGRGGGRKSNSTKLLQVCYGITCHKSQGSEWDTIIFINPWKQDSIEFVNKRLIYTSLSRAKNKCYIVGDVKGINNAIRRSNSNSVTLLPYHIDNNQ